MKKIIWVLVIFVLNIAVAAAICNDNPDANMYTGNYGTYSSSNFVLKSRCYGDYLAFPGCEDGEAVLNLIPCDCSSEGDTGKCIATVKEVFWVYNNLGRRWEWIRGDLVTEALLNSAVESWIYRLTKDEIPTPSPGPPPPYSSSSSSTDGAGGVPSTFTETISVSETEFSSGYATPLAESEKIEVRVGGESHYVGVIGITETTATIEVGSSPQRATLSIGEMKKFEVTDDNYYDIYVQLNRIESGKADLTIKSIYEEIPSLDREATKDSGLWMWALGLVVVAIIVVIIVLIKYNKK